MDPESYILLQTPTTAVTFEWTGILLKLLLFVIMLCGAFMAAAAEVAFFSITRTEADELHGKEDVASQKIWWLVKHPKHLIATILIINNFSGIGSMIAGELIVIQLADYFQLLPWQKTTLYVSSISALLILFGEIVPKVFAAEKKMEMATFLYQPVYLLTKFLTPFANLLISISQYIDRFFQPKAQNASLNDLKDAIEMIPENENIEANEKEILKGILNFSNISVKNIMIPRTQMIAISEEDSFEEIIATINEYGFSRMPVYGENSDDIKGILYIKDLVPLLQDHQSHISWKSLIRPAYFVPEYKKIDSLMEDFRNKRFHIAVVVDEFGGTSGIVTLDDIADEVFGEMRDEFDDETEKSHIAVNENTHFFKGNILLNDVIRVLELEEDEFDDIKGENDSLAGLILGLHGMIPETGETITYKHFEFNIDKASASRIELVKVVIQEKKES
ncbi:MAG: hemolysin family protein [Bacteroidia bacterium]